ncbi:hypothetical protein OIDMADRAFT_153650 [Oidiodendron maius Zn]|uniref:Zn(2)-C6 fungal-type domain-containing protein n=1 Tax=Oidiodendron maius (strain Zn) TaxID=913774 RepID=A0A0C3D2H5_OIDMZ|nr:hypothetical protein OIDMADRAFT_153650 [Oidiodendron maius Zn]
MTTALNSTIEQSSGLSVRRNATSSSNRPVQTSHVRACTNCVRAKAKCSSGIEAEGKCERCHRMSKDCRPSPPLRKRRAAKRPSAAETFKLEEKIDWLVTLLKSAQGVPGIANITSSHSIAPEASRPLNHNADSVCYRNDTYRVSPEPFSEAHYAPTDFSFPGPTSAYLKPPVLHPALQPSPEDAVSYLNRFRTDFVKHLPFIVISPSVTSKELRQERPILWVCIMTVASSNSTKQIALSKEVRAIFGREAYAEGTRSMDLLLAILVYTAWDRYHTFEKPIFSSLVQLAIAILYDLGLDKPPSKDPALALTYDLKGIKQPSRFSRPPTMEERRALLGCFLMSSVSSSFLQKGDTLRWTAYSNECLRVIERQKEFASDELLAHLVKLRLISERMVDTPCTGAIMEGDCGMTLPVVFYLKSLESQLRDFKSTISSALADNKTLLMELHNTELAIHGIGLSQASDIFSGPHNMRLECLYACFNAIKAWFDVFLSIPPAQYVGFSALLYRNLTHCFVAIYQLSTFEHPEWDLGFIRENLDVVLFLEKAERNFSDVKLVAGLDIDGLEDIDTFNIIASKIRVIKLWWETTTLSTTGSHGAASGEVTSGSLMEFLDDGWLRDVFGPWNI